MPAASGAIVFKDAVITVDSIQYTNQLRMAILNPDQSEQTYRTLVPDGAIQDVDSVVWAFQIEGLQINIAGGLAAYLRTNTGNNISCILQLKSGVGQPKATFTAIAKSPPFGGEQGAFMTMPLTLPVIGAPVFGTS
jgi:hypothetical protein